MSLLLENPTRNQDTSEDVDGEYLFFVGVAIVERDSFECWVCA